MTLMRIVFDTALPILLPALHWKSPSSFLVILEKRMDPSANNPILLDEWMGMLFSPKQKFKIKSFWRELISIHLQSGTSGQWASAFRALDRGWKPDSFPAGRYLAAQRSIWAELKNELNEISIWEQILGVDGP